MSAAHAAFGNFGPSICRFVWRLNGTSLPETKMRKSPLFHHGELTVMPSSDGQKQSINPHVTCGFEDVMNEEENATVHHHSDGSIKTFRFGHHSRLHHYSKMAYELRGPGDDAILQYHDVTVYRSDLKNLDNDEWLNDNNISFLYEYLEHSYLNESKKADKVVLLRPSMAYLLLHTEDPRSLKEVLPPLDNARFIFLPINDNPDVRAIEGGAHWSLLVIGVADKCALYYDTMESSNLNVSVKTTKQLGQLLNKNFQFFCVPTPQQANMSDCGVLVCEITSLLLSRLIESNENDKVDLSLENIAFVAAAGRTFILTVIMELISAQAKGKI